MMSRILNYIFIFSPYIATLNGILNDIGNREVAVSSVTEKLDSVISDVQTTFERLGVLDDFMAALFPLVCFTDEQLLSADWSEKATWAAQSLQLRYYERSDGGVEFFKRLEALHSTGDSSCPIVHLYVYCLRRGFKGNCHMDGTGFVIQGILRSYAQSIQIKFSKNNSGSLGNTLALQGGAHIFPGASRFLYSKRRFFAFLFFVFCFFSALLLVRYSLISYFIFIVKDMWADIL